MLSFNFRPFSGFILITLLILSQPIRADHAAPGFYYRSLQSNRIYSHLPLQDYDRFSI